MSKHTPGPWTTTKAYRHAPNTWLQFVFADKSTTAKRPAEAMGMTKEEAEANAHLIAAAPDMLEALENMVGKFTGGIFDSDLDEARAAITKAKGK